MSDKTWNIILYLRNYLTIHIKKNTDFQISCQISLMVNCLLILPTKNHLLIEMHFIFNNGDFLFMYKIEKTARDKSFVTIKLSVPARKADWICSSRSFSTMGQKSISSSIWIFIKSLDFPEIFSHLTCYERKCLNYKFKNDMTPLWLG